MKELLLLIRVSKPQYNEDLYRRKIVYMNPQLSFDKEGLLSGQADPSEGMLTDSPVKLFYSTDNKATWNYLLEAYKVKKENNAYIYCMYTLTYCEKNYDKQNNKYYCKIPWEYIKDVWEEGYELMVIKNTSKFLDYLKEAAEKEGVACAYGMVEYDLEEQRKKPDYYLNASNDPFMSVFHKFRNPYSVQQEFRFAIKDAEKPDHYELHLKDDAVIMVSLLRPKYGKDIWIELSDLVFDESGTLVRYSSLLNFYEADPE